MQLDRPANGLVAALTPPPVGPGSTPPVASTRDSSRRRRSVETGKACAIVQPPIAGQFVPRVFVPPSAVETYSGLVEPAGRISTPLRRISVVSMDGRYLAPVLMSPPTVTPKGMLAAKPPEAGVASRRVSVLEVEKFTTE